MMGSDTSTAHNNKQFKMMRKRITNTQTGIGGSGNAANGNGKSWKVAAEKKHEE